MSDLSQQDAQRELERLAQLSQHLGATPMALVSVWGHASAHLTASVGLAPAQIEPALAWCDEGQHQGREAWIVADTLQAPQWSQHPLVLGEPHVRFLACFPLVHPEEGVLGTLVILDTQARTLLPETLDALHLLALHAALQLQWRRMQQRLAQQYAALQAALQTALPAATEDEGAGKALHKKGEIIDINTHKKTPLAAQKDTITHTDLVQVQQQISSMELSLHEVLELVATAALRASGARGAMVELHEGDHLVMHACAGPLGAMLPLQNHTAWAQLKEGRTVLCNNTQAEGWNQAWADNAQTIRSVLAVPLRANQTVLGALNAVSDETDAFDQGDVEHLQVLMESLVQLRRMSAQLQTSEQQYRRLFQAHPQPMWVYAHDDGLPLLAVNDAMVATYGYSEAELLGMAVTDLWPLQTPAYTVVPGQCLKHLPTRHRRKDGSVLEIEASARCIDFNGHKGCQVMVSDVTERRRIEHDLERVGRARHLLSACNEMLMRAISESALLHAICRIMVEVGGYRMAWVGLAHDDAYKTIEPVAHAGPDDHFLDTLQLSWSDNVPQGLGMGGATVRTGELTLVPDLLTDPTYENYAERLRAHGFQGGICLPLRHGDHTFGVLCLYVSKVLQPGTEETYLLQELANDLAFGVMNLRTRQEQQRLQTVVIKVAAAVSATTGTEFFVQLASNMADAMGAQVACVARLMPASEGQADGPPPRMTSLALVINGQLQANAEYSLEHLPCLSLLTKHQHVVADRLYQQYPQVEAMYPLGAQSYAGQQLYDSQKKPLGMIFVLFHQPLKNIQFVTSTLQIFAARAAAEIERQVADARIRRQATLLDKAQDAIVAYDLQYRILFWNQGAERMYGWPQAQAQQQSVVELLYEDPIPFHQAIEMVLAHGEWVGERTQKHRSGELMETEVRLTLVCSEDGKPESILSINTDISQRKATERQIQHLAFYDALTGLPNRMLLTERMHHALAASQRNQQGGALLFIDMDNFKTLNDTLGHDMGDLLLKQVAQRLNGCVRSVDTVARLGGDEFVVVLEALSADLDELTLAAKDIGEKILASLAVPYKLAHYQYRSTPSIGIAPFLGDQHSVGDLLRHADLAMYQSKAAGRNTLHFFDPQMQAVVLARAELEAALRTALAESQFLLHYQPQVNHQDQFIGVEALVRWQHPERGLVLPADFIALAEETGLILPLGRWVLHVACSRLARWRSSPQLRHLTMSVNVSPRQFRHASFVTDVARILAITGAPAHLLKLELTESLLVENMETTIATMTTLSEYHVGFSLDDFGTGYSSLSYLKRMPLEQIKIDQSFVRDLLTDINDSAIVNTIIGLGKGLDLAVIAEGVETLAQRDALLQAGCRLFQGNLFSEPVPHEQLEWLLRNPLNLVPPRP
ncbi:EAL domain-containing protein [Simplicispira psychrophila]|uniref:EAL domain-containing protein n=1 Tax=Simplicispira psychrophila TaxID=80882 RepID=UPI001FE0ED46|nr:EAL domain-containing protein [Simplicispira psychrophila]